MSSEHGKLVADLARPGVDPDLIGRVSEALSGPRSITHYWPQSQPVGQSSLSQGGHLPASLQGYHSNANGRLAS